MVSQNCPSGARNRAAGATAGDMTSASRGAEQQRRAVCVVDDDPWVLDSLSVLLETLGFDVLTFTSGAEFLADERHRTAGCLVIDQHMPGMDGLDAVGELRREGLTIPAIVITGRLDADIAARAAKVAVTAILEKPFSTPRVAELVRASLDQAQ